MKIIVMTGATNGIGAEAMKHLAQETDTLILIGARGKNREVPTGTEALPLDLSSLESVRGFATLVKNRIGDKKINTLILNAGANFGNNITPTVDGFEPTFGTNHLAHYLLARLLWENMADNSKMIFTTSDTHDPALFPIGPKSLDPKLLAHPADPKLWKGMKPYTASKLCNLLTARHFAESEVVSQKRMQIIAYNPGATSGTSLAGKQSSSVKLLMKYMLIPTMRVVGVFKSQFYVGSVQRAGEALAELSLGKVIIPKGKYYASLVRGKIIFPNPSVLAQSIKAEEILWKESAAMVALPVNL